MKKVRGFEIAKGWEDKDIHIPVRKTARSAAYDIEAAEDIDVPVYKPGIKPTFIPTGLKAYCQDDECYFLMNRSGGPKKGFLTPHGVGLIDADYYENPENDGHFLVQVFNCSDKVIHVKKGDAIAQVMFTKFLICDGDRATGIRKGGFGSTDKK